MLFRQCLLLNTVHGTEDPLFELPAVGEDEGLQQKGARPLFSLKLIDNTYSCMLQILTYKISVGRRE